MCEMLIPNWLLKVNLKPQYTPNVWQTTDFYTYTLLKLNFETPVHLKPLTLILRHNDTQTPPYTPVHPDISLDPPMYTSLIILMVIFIPKLYFNWTLHENAIDHFQKIGLVRCTNVPNCTLIVPEKQIYLTTLQVDQILFAFSCAHQVQPSSTP